MVDILDKFCYLFVSLLTEGKKKGIMKNTTNIVCNGLYRYKGVVAGKEGC